MTRQIRVLFLTVFVDAFGFGIVLPFLPLYAHSLGATALEVGLLLATYSGAQMIVAPWWGRLSDRVGRKPVIVIAAAGTAASFVVIAFASRLAIVFAGRALLGSFGVGMATAQAWIADTTSPDERGRALALLGAANALGFTLGPALGALGVATGGLALPFWFAAACAATSAALAAAVLPTVAPRAREVTASARVPIRGLFACLAVAFVLTYAFSGVEATFTLFTSDELAFTPTENGLFYVMLGLEAAATQALGTRWLATRVPEHRRVALGLVLLATGSVLLPMARSGVELAVPTTLLAMGFGITNPSLAAWVSRTAPADRQGEALGLAQSAGALARLAGPGLGGLMFDHLGHPWPFRIAAVLIGATALLAARA